MQMRHGDVWIEAVEEIPAHALKVAPGPRGYVLAEGEATGHAHTIEATPDIQMYEKAGVLYLRVTGESATVQHQEHAAGVIPKGTYRVEKQYGYSAGMVRRVID